MKISRTLGIALLIIGNIAIDQISKILIRIYVNYNEIIPLIGDTFIMTKVENSGAFLGIGSDLSPIIRLLVLLILPILVLGYLIYFILKNKELDRYSIIALTAIAGGGIANVYDRIVYGEVTDFLHIDFGGVFRTGIFNIADVSVSTGMIMLFVGSFILNKKTI
ncbi:signal peptidase II [Lacinutrix undariae]